MGGGNGVFGKLSNMNPKTQTALAVGGGVLAGAFLDHEVHEHTGAPVYQQNSGHHHMLGDVAGLLGAAGVGALGAKFFGKKTQAAQPGMPPQGYPPMQPGAPVYGAPAFPSVGPPPGNPGTNPSPGFGGLGSLGKLAAGGAAGLAGGLAVGEATNFFHHHNQNASNPPPAPGVGGGALSFFSNMTNPEQSLHILAATYSDKDVTYTATQMINSQQQLFLENIIEAFGDPWPEVQRKSFSAVYQYGNRPLEIFAGR
jgi:hypothetical protein